MTKTGNKPRILTSIGEESYSLNIMFRPQEVGRYKAQLKIIVTRRGEESEYTVIVFLNTKIHLLLGGVGRLWRTGSRCSDNRVAFAEAASSFGHWLLSSDPEQHQQFQV